MFSSVNVQANEAGIWFFRDKGVGYTATAREEKGKKGGGRTFMPGRPPRYYHQRNEREGTVIEVKRDSRPFMGYGIVTMKLALGWTDASGDRQWLRWSLHRVEELCRNIVAVLVVFCRCRWRYCAKLFEARRSQSRLADSCCSFAPTSVRSPREVEAGNSFEKGGCCHVISNWLIYLRRLR